MNYSFAWTGPNGFSANSEDLNNLQAGSYDLLVTDANGCTQSVSADLAAPGPGCVRILAALGVTILMIAVILLFFAVVAYNMGVQP